MDRHPISSIAIRTPSFKTMVVLLVTVVMLPGCSTFNLWNRKEDERVRELTETKDVQGPLQRMMAWTDKTDVEELQRNPGYYEQGRNEFRQAEQLFQQRQWEESESELKAIAKRFDDYAVKEDALFLLGEVYYETKRYPEASDTFTTLVKEFPSTRHQTKISNRMFSIAGIWLDFPDAVTSNDIQLASNLEQATKMGVPANKRNSWDPTLAMPFLPNFHDSTRPAFDTEGRALESLKSIWLNDPTSDMADDALMMTASHYLRKGDSVRADEYFAALRQNYPDSPHFKNSYVLGSHVKLMSYEGSNYDGTRLDEAEQLKESALRMWPDSEMRGRLTEELKIIEEAKAKREWGRVEFYNKKKRPDSAAIYCREIIRLYPETSYASSAKQFLATNQLVAPASVRRIEAPTESKARSWNWSLFPQLEKVPEPKEESSGKATFSSPDAFSSPAQEPQPYDESERIQF